MKGKKIGSLTALVAAGVIWGGSFVVTKDALDYLTPAWQLALRLLVASVPAILIACVYQRKWTKARIQKSMILGSAFFGALFLQNIGMQYVSASKAGFLTTTYVAFVPLISMVVLRKRVKKRQVLAAGICMVGAAMLATQDVRGVQAGDILVLCCGFLYAVHLLLTDRYKEEDSLMLHVGQILVAAFLSVLAAVILEPLPVGMNMHVMSGLMYCGLLEVFLCFFLQIIGQTYTPPALASILLSMESVYSAIFASIFLQESMSLVMWTGCLMILAAAMINGNSE